MNSKGEETNQSPIIKATGVTESERYLNKLCQNTFLSLWSYPCLYKNQGSGRISGGSKELCDLIVFFEKHIIIFSDKDCVFPNTGDIELDWNRWFKSAIEEGADQIYGAEKWIKQHPDRIFIDRECTQKFPLKVPHPTEAIFHRIAVAHGASKRCKEVLGGSGSLILDPSIVGKAHKIIFSEGQPFVIGQINSEKGYVHVFDEITLDIILTTVDTISDFTRYLSKKEQLILNGKLKRAKGEEDLLAYYLQNYDSEGYLHEFVVPFSVEQLEIEEGQWEIFNKSDKRLNQIEVNKISYYWDDLIEDFNESILDRTIHASSQENVAEQALVIHLLAREDRTRRRILARELYKLSNKAQENYEKVGLIGPSRPDNPYYIFLSHPYYRLRERLEQYCLVVKYLHPDAQDIIGIGVQSDSKKEELHRIAYYYNARSWSTEYINRAKYYYEYLGLLKNAEKFNGIQSEYPHPNDGMYPENLSAKPKTVLGQTIRVEPKNPRNKLCSCNSGLKYKKCCGKKVSFIT